MTVTKEKKMKKEKEEREEEANTLHFQNRYHRTVKSQASQTLIIKDKEEKK